MRIALVNEYFPPHAPGGAEWSVEALARALAGRGHGVVGEAMSCGLPVVASSRGSVPEILADGQGGTLADPSAPERFADALSMLLAEPGRRAALGRANRARIDAGFRWDRCVVDTVAVYEDAVATRRSAARVPR
jgi:glycosyltransferase involved in cell wall biosynthesis